MSRISRVAALLVAVLIIGGVAYVAAAAHERVNVAPASLNATPLPSPTPSLSEVARDSIGVVVTVQGIRNNTESFGTGWLYDTQGDFVTNAHVILGDISLRIRDRAGNLHVATIVSVDNKLDVALLHCIDGFSGTPLKLGSSDGLHLPLDVVVIASGRATGHPDVTLETLSQSGRTITVENNPDLDPGVAQISKVYNNMLELDGNKIFQGNSGGPVLDSNGKVIGILTLASKTGSAAYAIPISEVSDEISFWAQNR